MILQLNRRHRDFSSACSGEFLRKKTHILRHPRNNLRMEALLLDALAPAAAGPDSGTNAATPRPYSAQTTTEVEEPRTGAEIVLDALLECGVDTVFGYPGGAALPLYDALYRRPQLRHVLVRHEQAAVHAAEGYARSTG